MGEYEQLAPCNDSPASQILQKHRYPDIPIPDIDLEIETASNSRRIFVDLYVMGCICIIGFFGNAVTVLVLRRDPARANNTTNWLLQTLALVDTVYLMTCLLIQPLKVINDHYTTWLPVSICCQLVCVILFF